jgi:hypothetical protein
MKKKRRVMDIEARIPNRNMAMMIRDIKAVALLLSQGIVTL